MINRPLNEKWPGVTYADDIYKDLRAQDVSKSNARAVAYLHGDTEQTNRNILARSHLKAIFDSKPDDSEGRAQHETKLWDISKLTAAQVIAAFPAVLGRGPVEKYWENEELFFQGLSLHMMAWARNRASVAAIRAMGHEQMASRAYLSKTAYALIARLCKEKSYTGPRKPVYAWLLYEASFHRGMLRHESQGLSDDHEIFKRTIKSMELALPTFTEHVNDKKERYERFEGMVRHAAGEVARKNESFRRSQYARYTKALKAWGEEVARFSERKRPRRPVEATYRPRKRMGVEL